LNEVADNDMELVYDAAETLRMAAQRSVQLEAPSDPMENAFGGDSDISLAQSEHDRLTGAAEAPAPQDEQVQDSDDAFGLFDDNQDGNDPFDDPFGLATAEAPSPAAAPVAAREGGLDLDDIFLATFTENDAAAPVAAPVPAAAAPAPAPPEAPVAMTPEQVVTALADLGVSIDEAAATSNPVLRPLLGIARATAEAAQREAGGKRRGWWEAPEPDIADSLLDAFTRRRLPLPTGASVARFLAEVLSCSDKRITNRYNRLQRSLAGAYLGQEASAPDLAALARELEAFVEPFATSLRNRPASASQAGGRRIGVDGAPRRTRSPVPGDAPRAATPPPPVAAPAAAAAPRAAPARKPRARRAGPAVVAASPGQNRGTSTTINVDALPQLDSIPTHEVPSYDSLINFRRTTGFCSMCGKPRGEGDGHVEIPTQNRDVCKVCDTATWKHNPTGAYFRWCKGCKRFHEIHAFAGKLKSPKCDDARARARASDRASYARRAAEAAPAPAPAATADPGGAVAPAPAAAAQPVAAPAPAAAAETVQEDAAMEIS